MSMAPGGDRHQPSGAHDRKRIKTARAEVLGGQALPTLSSGIPLGDGHDDNDDDERNFHLPPAPPWAKPPPPPSNEDLSGRDGDEDRRPKEEILRRARALAGQMSLNAAAADSKPRPFSDTAFLLGDAPAEEGAHLQHGTHELYGAGGGGAGGGVVLPGKRDKEEDPPVPSDLMQHQIRYYVDLASSRLGNISRAASDALTVSGRHPLPWRTEHLYIIFLLV